MSTILMVIIRSVIYLPIMVRITLMYYVDFYTLFNNPEKDWEISLSHASGAPPQPSIFD